MIPRYEDSRVARDWDLKAKYELWQTTELAVICARERLARIQPGLYLTIRHALEAPIDAGFIAEREEVIRHDLNAFLEERVRFLTPELAIEFHKHMTSYDTEESAFIRTLKQSCEHVMADAVGLLNEIRKLCLKYRYTPMNARTHGNEAEMQSFAKRCLTWYKDIDTGLNCFKESLTNLQYSKLSGAIGTNSGIDPELEKVALDILGFKPWTGATQIMPRILYAPIASSMAQLCLVVDKASTDIRLGARSGRPLWHEPFGKGQKGSSAMPHKKNTIITENIGGMARMAKYYAAGLQENIGTWEERDISQSSVERVFWPDLLHVTLRALQNLKKVMSGLVVYQDNMMLEIIESRGTYASNEAKEMLAQLGLEFGLDREEAYRIVQLAAWNAFEPSHESAKLRYADIGSRERADLWLGSTKEADRPWASSPRSIQDIIVEGALRKSSHLDADEKTVAKWNEALRKIFSPDNERNGNSWDEIFRPSHILRNEDHLFLEVFGQSS